MTETVYDVLDRIETVDAVEVATEATSLQLLQAVYSNPAVPLSVRMRAAIAALPFAAPKPSVVASVNDDGRFAERLEAAIARSGKAPLMIEACRERLRGSV